jgi:hypothetical protein
LKRSTNGFEGGTEMDEDGSVASDTACWFLIVRLIAACFIAFQAGWA